MVYRRDLWFIQARPSTTTFSSLSSSLSSSPSVYPSISPYHTPSPSSTTMTSSVHISGTPTKRGGRITGYSKDATIDHCVANSDGVQDVQFFDKYLQPLNNDTLPIRWGWKAFKGRIQKKFKESSEKAIYDPVASLLNKISCLVYQDMYPSKSDPYYRIVYVS